MSNSSPASKLRALGRPRLKADRRPDVVGDAVFLTTEFRHFVVQGRAAGLVLPYLDGNRTVSEIAAELSDRLPITEVLAAVGKYAELGHLVEGPEGEDRAAAAWWDALGVGAETAGRTIAASSVVVTSLGEASAVVADELRMVLERSSVHVLPVVGVSEPRGSLHVVVVDDYLRAGLEEFNDAALEAGTPWLIVRLCGAQLWFGPYFVPGRTACWKCLAQRIAANRQVERFVATTSMAASAVTSPPAMVPSSLTAAVGIAAGEVLTILARSGSELLENTLVTLDIPTLQGAQHPVQRQPQCAACGDPSLAASIGPVVLAPQPAAYTGDGGHRICSPAETVERLERHVSPITGAISKLHRLTAPGDEVSHAYAAGHNFALFTRSVYYLRRNLRGLAGGKGRSDIQAKASAMSEAIERYSGVWRGDEPVVRARLSSLEDAIHPGDLLCFSDRQYEERASWNAAQVAGNHVVPEPFDPEREIEWSQVWSMTSHRRRLVPASYCYYGHPDGAQEPFCYADSNGNAAGNTLEEAILQGMLELIERDSVAIWWYNRLQVPKVDLDSFEDSYMSLLIAHYATMGRSLWMLDITSDLGIPVFVVISHRLDHPVEDIIVASGAHLEPKLAAMRALTECNQYLPMLAERDASGNTVYLIDDREANNWWANASLAGEGYLVPDARSEPRDAQALENLSDPDITKEVMTCVERIEGAGAEVLVLDQTRPDLDLNVVKVMAPGLRHFWRRLGPGRLYDVPVTTGRLKEPLAEEEVNPKSVFY